MKGRRNEKGYLKPCSSPSRRSVLDVHRRMPLAGRCRSSALQLEDNGGPLGEQEPCRSSDEIGPESENIP